MNNFWLLVKINLLSIFRPYRSKRGSVQAGRTSLALVGVVVLVAYLLFSLYQMAQQMAVMLAPVGALELLLAMGMGMGTLMVLITGIYKMPTYLFSFRDFDLLMSLPIQRSTILSAKLSALYASNFGFMILILAPFAVTYGMYAQVGVTFYLLAFLLSFFLPLLPMVVSALLALGLAKLASLLKAKNLVMIVGSILLLIVVMGFSFSFSFMSSSDPKAMVAFGDTLNTINFPGTLYIAATAGGDMISLLLFLLLEAGVAAVFVLLFSRSFLSINSAMQISQKKRKVELAKIKTRSPLGALVHKELKGFFGDFLYVMNCGFGLVLLTIGAIVLCFLDLPAMLAGEDIPLEQMRELFLGIVCAITAMFLCFTNITAPSISLEGKQFWIIKTLPVRESQFLGAKMLFALIILLPLAVLDGLLFAFSLKLELLQALSLLAIIFTVSLFSIFGGLSLNLLFPKMDYKNRVQALKQGMSVFLSVMMGFVVLGAGIGLYFAFAWLPMEIYLFLAAGLLAIVDVLLYIFIRTYGVRRIRSLSA